MRTKYTEKHKQTSKKKKKLWLDLYLVMYNKTVFKVVNNIQDYYQPKYAMHATLKIYKFKLGNLNLVVCY